MNYLRSFIVLVLAIILSACASSKRFTSDEDNIYDINLSDSKNLEFLEQGIASYYADEYHGKKTASGETYNMNEMTAAHPTLPFEVRLLVVNTKNNKSVIVRVNDRMPSFKGRIIDLSLAAAKKIDMIRDGTVEVKVYKIKMQKVPN